jgi:hypothetical protein
MSELSVAAQKVASNKAKLEIMLPDTRGVTISRWMKNNLKLGPNVVTYSKLALASCPGASVWCKKDCYAQRIKGVVEDVYRINTQAGADVPDLPENTELCRPHVSGDFDSVAYIDRWIYIVRGRPDVLFWAYTRSCNVPELMPALSVLQALPNMQLFASMDESTPKLPPDGWRIAWIEGDMRIGRVDGHTSIVCPEERKKVENCEKCRYCFTPFVGIRDVVFLKH